MTPANAPAARAGSPVGGPVREVRWRRVVDPAALAALAAIVIDTVSPVDDTTGQPADLAERAEPSLVHPGR